MTKIVKKTLGKGLRTALFGNEFQDYYGHLLSSGRDCPVTADEAHRDVDAQRRLLQRAALSMGHWVM